MSTKRQKKFDAMNRIIGLLQKHKQIILVSLENVGSNQVQQIRRELNKRQSLLVIGKNTVITRAASLLVDDETLSTEKFSIFKDTIKSKVPQLK